VKRHLSNREWQVAGQLATGKSYAAIARQLRKPNGEPITARTVEAHVARIAAKLPNPDGLSPRTLVMLWARDQNAAA